MKKLILLICLFVSVTLSAQINQDSLIIPTCQQVDTTKQIYVSYSVILFESNDSINLNSVIMMTDVVVPYIVAYVDPKNYEMKNLCVLGLRDGEFIVDRFNISEEYANYLVDIHKSDYPNVKIVPIYSER